MWSDRSLDEGERTVLPDESRRMSPSRMCHEGTAVDDDGLEARRYSEKPERPRRLSFREAMEIAERQVDFEATFLRTSKRQDAHELCRVMAEVYMMPPATLIRIERDELPAEMVAEVFRELDAMHIEHCIERKRAMVGVRYPKAYMRVMLYNAVMLEAYDDRMDYERILSDTVGRGTV